MKVYDLTMLVLQMIANSETVLMALFTAYIDDDLGYEIFCDDLPADLFCILKGNLEKHQDLRDALKDNGLLEQGVKIYLDTAFDDYNMLYHLMDGLSTILNDPVLSDMVPEADRRILEGMFQRWQEGELGEDNWEDAFNTLCIERASK